MPGDGFLESLGISAIDIPKYEVLGEIGHGGMATVYRARDPRLNREVALKVIHRHLRDSAEVYRRFSSEALAVAKVRHPNIVDVYDVSSGDDLERYLVVELIEGPTLRQELEREGPLPVEVAISIAIEVCRGLCQAHSAGVIHRDVKPENVLLSTSDLGGVHDADPARVKLTDFGIAKLLDAQGVTHTGQVLGSPAHMAPEQIEGGSVDGRADVFSVGVMLYEMLSGNLPFAGSNPAQVLKRVLDGHFTPLIECAPQVGQGYSQLVERALARDVEERFQTVEALLESLSAELKKFDLESPRAVIAFFLDDSLSYRSDLEQRVVEQLIEQGIAAQKSGQSIIAARALNRALAYRPDDSELLSRVAGLRKREARKRKLAQLKRWALFSLPFIALTLGITFFLSRSQIELPEVSLDPKALPVDGQMSSAESDGPNMSVLPPEEIKAKKAKPIKQRKLIKRRGIRRPKNPGPAATRAVRTPVVGPQNAQVKIDGEVFPWFRVHQLTLGEHQVEFIPPKGGCCKTPKPQIVQVVSGEGSQTVRGVIAYKSATLRFSGAKGYRASCGIGAILAPGVKRVIPMDRASKVLSCKVYPPANEGREPQESTVTLRPGKTSILQGG